MLQSNPERHRVPLTPRVLLLYQRQTSKRAPLEVRCWFQSGYSDGQPGERYALMKAFQSQYSPAWRPELLLTPDWSSFRFQASAAYRRELDQQWLRLFDLESALTDLEPLKNGLQQEQRYYQEALADYLKQSFIKLAFQGTPYGVSPLGEPGSLAELGQEQMLDSWQSLQECQVVIQLCDHQSLPEVLQRLKPLIKADTEPTSRQPFERPLGLREQRLTASVEGAWLELGFVLPGMHSPSWVYGPVLAAWLQDIWAEHPPDPGLQLLDSQCYSWQQASLLHLRLHGQVENLQESKVKLLQWLALSRQEYLTSRRLQQAAQRVGQHLQQSPPPPLLMIDEIQHGWGYLRQRLQQLSLSNFEHLLQTHLNADQLVLQETFSGHNVPRQQPDHHKYLATLGYAAPAKAPQAASKRYENQQRLHLSPHWSMWCLPHNGLSGLELGVWFASGGADDAIPGVTHLLFQALEQRFLSLLEDQRHDPRISTKFQASWQWQVTPDACFFKWAVNWGDLPQALRVLHDLLLDLPLSQAGLNHLKQKQLLRLQAAHLHPQYLAHHQFLRSGFANHPYASPLEGDFISVKQIQLERLQQRWHYLRQTALANPLLLGDIPQFLTANVLSPAFEGIRESQGSLPPMPPVRVRRGEIPLPSQVLQGYRCEGPLFEQPLALSELLPWQLSLMWLQDRVRALTSMPFEIEFQPLKHAWYFCLKGLYERLDRKGWLYELHQIDQLELVKQRLYAELQKQLQDSQKFWPLLVQRLSLGQPPGEVFELEHQLLTLQANQIEACLSQLQDDRQWLQVSLQAQEQRVPAWGLRGGYA